MKDLQVTSITQKLVSGTTEYYSNNFHITLIINSDREIERVNIYRVNSAFVNEEIEMTGSDFQELANLSGEIMRDNKDLKV